VGVRLIVEVLDHWQDVGLTAGERNDLIVLAENANDKSRLTYGPVHAPYILKRANKAAEGWKNSIGKLLRKKVITTDTPGRIKQFAVYRLEMLCPDPPHDGYKGYCTRPDGPSGPDTSPEVGHSSGDPVGVGHSSGDPAPEEGHLTGADRVTSPVTPTPHDPSTQPPSTAAGRPAAAAGKHAVADELTAAFWEHHGAGRAQSFIAVRSVIRTCISNGIPRDDLAHALDRLAREGRPISGGTVQIALTPQQAPSARRPFTNPTDHDVYDGEFQ